MIVLTIFLWLLAGIAGLIALCLLLLCVSAGVSFSNRTGETKIVARYGIFRYKIAPRKTPSEKKALRKAQRRTKKTLKKAQKTARRQRKKTLKKAKETGAKKGKLRSFIASVFDYDVEYLKVFYFKKLCVGYRVGGTDFADIGRKYAHVSELIGAAFPVLNRTFKIKKYRVILVPDFVSRKTELSYDIVLLVRPIRLLAAAYRLWRANERNLGYYGDKKPKTASKKPDKPNNRKTVSGVHPDGNT